MDKNSLDQLCINFINEKIQNFDIQRLIKDEITYYRSENLDFPKIDYLDNAKIVGMIITHLFN